jgi:hypothetical protein
MMHSFACCHGLNKADGRRRGPATCVVTIGRPDLGFAAQEADMNSESEMQAKIAIAAALIAAGTYDMGLVHMYETNALGHIHLGQLRTAVDVIYKGLTDPK